MTGPHNFSWVNMCSIFFASLYKYINKPFSIWKLAIFACFSVWSVSYMTSMVFVCFGKFQVFDADNSYLQSHQLRKLLSFPDQKIATSRVNKLFSIYIFCFFLPLKYFIYDNVYVCFGKFQVYDADKSYLQSHQLRSFPDLKICHFCIQSSIDVLNKKPLWKVNSSKFLLFSWRLQLVNDLGAWVTTNCSGERSASTVRQCDTLWQTRKRMGFENYIALCCWVLWRLRTNMCESPSNLVMASCIDPPMPVLKISF